MWNNSWKINIQKVEVNAMIDFERVKELYETPLSMRKVAETMGYSNARVGTVIKEMGISRTKHTGKAKRIRKNQLKTSDYAKKKYSPFTMTNILGNSFYMEEK